MPERTRRNPLRRFALLARFPRRLRHRQLEEEWPGDWPVVHASDLVEYPNLANDLKVWLDGYERRFRVLDHKAQVLQNQFRSQHVALIAGSLLATSLGAVQAALGGGVAALAVAQAMLTGVLAGLAVLVRSRRAQQGYLTARLKAERVKSEFFLFLGRAGNYAGENPEVHLAQQVDDIEAAEGVA